VNGGTGHCPTVLKLCQKMAKTHLDPSNGDHSPRGGISPGKFFLLLVVVAIILYLLQAIGLPVVYRTDSTEIIERPHR
jgi:hypothetical protein